MTIDNLLLKGVAKCPFVPSITPADSIPKARLGGASPVSEARPRLESVLWPGYYFPAR